MKRNKVLILSTETDQSTNDVIDWLKVKKVDYIRLNDTDHIILEKYELVNSKPRILLSVVNRGILIDSDEIVFFWYRRGVFRMKNKSFYDQGKGSFATHFNRFVNDELDRLLFVVNNSIANQKLGNYLNNDINKIEVLEYAQNIGIAVPKTIITTKKEELINFFHENNGDIISKCISNSPQIKLNEKSFYSLTAKVIKEDIEEEFFFPSLFQENINKHFEIRSFYLNNKFYSSAIFSQNNNKTTIDFRAYDRKKPNRVIPFILPIKIKNQLRDLMVKLNLKTGSIDIIVSKDNCYYFLEVNPIGQFGQVSRPCNYYLEEAIANYLTN